MATVVVTASALADIESIGEYLAQEVSMITALAVSEKLKRCAQSLSENPERGQLDHHFGLGRRRLIERPYLIIYEITQLGRVDILRILHGARDLPSLFLTPEGE